MENTPPAEELLRKIQELEAGHAQLKEEMSKLIISGDQKAGRQRSHSVSPQRRTVTPPRRGVSSGGFEGGFAAAFKIGSASFRHSSPLQIESQSLETSNSGMGMAPRLVPPEVKFTDIQYLNIQDSMGQSVHIFDLDGRIVYRDCLGAGSAGGTGFFKQFGTIKRLRIARNKKTGKSKHFGFIEFESPEVAKIVADTMHNYLLFEHLLQVCLIPPERVHPKLWKGVSRWYKPLDWVQIERKQHNKERTFDEHRKLVEGIMKRDERRRKRIEATGIDYECPEVVGSNQPAPKKIRFAE